MLRQYYSRELRVTDKPSFHIIKRTTNHYIPKVYSTYSILLNSKKPFKVKIVEVYEQSFSFQFLMGNRLYLQSVGYKYHSRQQIIDAIRKVKKLSGNLEYFSIRSTVEGCFYYCLFDPMNKQDIAVSIPYDSREEAYNVLSSLVYLITDAEVLE